MEKFPSTFDLAEDLSKQYFPHLFNTAGNIRCPTLPFLPEKADYIVNGMKLEKRKNFLSWYEEHKNEKFNLIEKLSTYCVADVKLLTAGLVKYREMFIEECNIDVLENCTTLASAVMEHFRTNVLQKNTIAIASELSYEDHSRQSTIARKYLKWLGEKHQVEIQYVDSLGGEKRLTPSIHLDGYVKNGFGEYTGNELAIEIYGYTVKCLQTKNFRINLSNF